MGQHYEMPISKVSWDNWKNSGRKKKNNPNKLLISSLTQIPTLGWHKFTIKGSQRMSPRKQVKAHLN